MAFHAVMFFQAQEAVCAAPSFVHRLAGLRVTASIQQRKSLPPMDSEFHKIQWPVAFLEQNIELSFAGGHRECRRRARLRNGENPPQHELVTIGIQRSPEKFLHEALHIGNRSQHFVSKLNYESFG